MTVVRPTFYEFFAGGGMARAGLGEAWDCLFANDIDAKKGASYAANWGNSHLKIVDVARLRGADLPGRPDLVWASFPCQDLSLAGGYVGLKGERSGTFWPFWRLTRALADEGRAPTVVVLENVCGALTSHDGQDFAAIGAALAGGGYRFGALVMDAARFVPQSRPRLFIIAVLDDRDPPARLTTDEPSPVWHSTRLIDAYEGFTERLKRAWLWWNLPVPPERKSTFADLIEDQPKGVGWHALAETKRLLSLMSPIHHKKVDAAKRTNKRMVGGVYRRTRQDPDGKRLQRAEIRFDDVAGCLRTPAGGSSRQSIMIVKGESVRSRLLSPREAARLMGLPDTYKLPENYNEAYQLVGDGLVVPVVRFLAANLLEPLLIETTQREKEAA